MAAISNDKINKIMNDLSRRGNVKVVSSEENYRINKKISEEMQNVKREYIKKEKESHRDAAKTVLTQ